MQVKDENLEKLIQEKEFKLKAGKEQLQKLNTKSKNIKKNNESLEKDIENLKLKLELFELKNRH